MGKRLRKMENSFRNNLKLISKISKEKINDKTFGEHFNNEMNYLSIIRVWGAALNCWKKTSLLENLKEKTIFYYRRIKSKKRINEPLKYKIKKNQVVFFPISETQTMIIEPIIKNLLDKGEYPYVLRFDYSLNGMKQEFEKRSIPYINFEYFLRDDIRKDVRKIKKDFDWVLPAYKNISKRKQKYFVLYPFFNYYFGNRNRFYEIVEFMEAFKIFLTETKPSLVFLTDDANDVPRAASYLCKKMGVPCIVSQHGNIDSNSLIVSEMFVIKKLVFGNFARKILKAMGVPIKDIEIVGSPIYDSLKKTCKGDKLKFRKSIGIYGKEKIILLDSSKGDSDEAKEKLIYLIKIIKKYSNFKLIIKQHPAEYRCDKYKRLYIKIAKQYGLPIIISQDKISDMLNISNVFITGFSTTTIEALALDVPIILLDIKREYDYKSFPKSKRVLEYVTKLDCLEKTLKKILNSKDTKSIIKNRKKIMENNAGKIDGKATERIVKIINRLKL